MENNNLSSKELFKSQQCRVADEEHQLTLTSKTLDKTEYD